MVRSVIYLGAALLFLVIGLSLVWLPFPAGFPFFALALGFLVAGSRRAAGMVLASRRRVARLDRTINWVEKRGGRRVAKVLRRTRPGRLPRRADSSDDPVVP